MSNLQNNIFCRSAKIQIIDGIQTLSNNSNNAFYRIKLSDFKDVLQKLKLYLNTYEIDRSERYYQKKDKDRYIICKALLRYLLSHHTGIVPHMLRFKSDANKKPYLLNQESLFYNVTHAGAYALIVISNAPIGVDIENLNKEFNFNEIVSKVFNNEELKTLSTSNNKKDTFYKLWTRKEAMVKATGLGITDDFLDIPALDGYHILESSLMNGLKKLEVISFDFNDDYKGAVALSQDLPYTDDIVFHDVSAIKCKI